MNHQGKAQRTTGVAIERAPSSAVNRALFENSELAFYVIAVLPDGAFRFEDANAAVAPFQTRPHESLVGCTPADGLIPEISLCLEENLGLCLASGEVHSYDRSMDLPSGRMSWTTSLTPITDGDGRIDHIVGITRDTTQEQRLLSAVGQRSSLMEGIDATAVGLIYLFDLKGKCSRFVGGKSNLGFEPSELTRMGADLLPQLIHPDDMPATEHNLEIVSRLADGEIAEYEYRMRHKDGHYVHCLSRDTVFSRDAAGEVELLLGVAVDVSELREMQSELRLLSEKLVTSRSDERRRIAQDLHDSTGQHLVAAELAVARIQSAYSSGACGPASANMDEALSDVMSEIKEAEREIRVLSFLLHPPGIESRGLVEAMRSLVLGFGSRAGLDIDVKIDPAAGGVPEHVAVAVYRVCQEALTNVHRHARATSVIVALDLSEDMVRLTVADDGVGFDAANIANVAGVGLGLSGMRGRVEELGGSISVHCDGGTTVVAKLPRASIPFPRGRSILTA